MQTVDDSTFHEKVRESTDAIVVYFTGSWCKPCQNFGPIVEKMSQRMQGDVTFLKADMDEAETVGMELNIRSLPSLVLFEGGMIRDVKSGTCSAEELRLWIQENI
ncbi:HNH endonuclease [Sulfitobacter phage vB_SupP_AX]|nr:HNH endonuclease [Sulfitobacter phage vB_SupP_AX]